MRLLRNVILTVVGGLLMAIVLFFVTFPQGPSVYIGMPSLGDLDFVVDVGGTDPWTGVYRDAFRSRPYETGTWWTIPLPVGFAIGAFLVMAVIFARSDRAKRLHGNAATATWRLIRTTALVVTGGLLTAIVLFSMTAPDVGHARTRIGDRLVAVGDTNPWTGEVRFSKWSSGQRGEVVDSVKVGTVIPPPLGFAIGGPPTLAVITIAARRPGRTAAHPAISEGQSSAAP